MGKYYPEEKKIENAMKNLYREFFQTRKEILESNLSDAEKEEEIEALLLRIKNAIDALRRVRSLFSIFKNTDRISDKDREILETYSDLDEVVVDENVINTLVEIYAKKAIELEEEVDTTQFEEELRKYFTEHYNDLLDTTMYNDFLGEFEGEKGKLVEIAQRCNIYPKKIHEIGFQLIVQEGVVAEFPDGDTLKAYYATPKGINNIISEIYNKIAYHEARGGDRNGLDSDRKIKNAYINYAKEHGIELEDKDVLEEIQVDNTKVQAIAEYINRVLNDRYLEEPTDNTEVFAEEIARRYSEIMNLGSYNFTDLKSVKELIGGKGYIESLSLRIEDDSIIHNDYLRSYDIVYATPEYLKAQYDEVMAEVKKLHPIKPFEAQDLTCWSDSQQVNRKKRELRRYIQEKGIEGIDISIPQVEVDHNMTNLIADALMEVYGPEYEEKETMRDRILSKLETNWSEIKTEQEYIDINELFKDELKEMGRSYVWKDLYVKDDFVVLVDNDGVIEKCIYATPEALRRSIEEFDRRILSSYSDYDDRENKKVLEQYAKLQGIELPNRDKISLAKLDNKLTDLKEKEIQVKKLCGQYEELLLNDRLPEK